MPSVPPAVLAGRAPGVASEVALRVGMSRTPHRTDFPGPTSRLGSRPRGTVGVAVRVVAAVVLLRQVPAEVAVPAGFCFSWSPMTSLSTVPFERLAGLGVRPAERGPEREAEAAVAAACSSLSITPRAVPLRLSPLRRMPPVVPVGRSRVRVARERPGRTAPSLSWSCDGDPYARGGTTPSMVIAAGSNGFRMRVA